MANMRKEQAEKKNKAARSAFQEKMAKQPGKAYKEIFQPVKDEQNLHASPLLQSTKVTHTDPQRVLDIVQNHFKNLLAPTHIIKTGNYKPETRPTGTGYPFETPETPDNFTLTREETADEGVNHHPPAQKRRCDPSG